MAWYDTGTVSVTNGSTAVTGSGTNFIAGAQVGEAFYGPDDNLYEIISITSATALVLADPYLGSTQTGQGYKIVPTQSLVASLATQVTALISDFQTVADEAGAGKFNDGTAVSPAITFTQDQDNGFYRPATNQIGFATGGAQRLLLSNTALTSSVPFSGTSITGSKGTFTNTTAAEAGLTVSGAEGNGWGLEIATHNSGTASDLVLSGNAVVGHGTSVSYTIPTAGYYRWMAGATSNTGGTAGSSEKMRLTSAGSVGIGTSNPSEKLEVAGNILVTSTAPRIDLTDTNNGSPNTFRLISEANQFRIQTVNSGTYISQDYAIQSGASGATSHTWKIGAANAMHINSLGNVGIANTTPEALLYVGGDGTSLGETAGNNLNLLTLHADTTNNDLLQFTSERLTTGTDWTHAAHRIQRKVDATPMGYMQFGHNTFDLITFGEGSTEYMRIDGGGSTLFGTTSFAVYNDDTGEQGVVVGGTGTIQSSRNNATNLLLNRQGSDGNTQGFYREGVSVGSISVTGSATAYNTSSDYRLKENITPIQGAADVVMAMQPCTYTAKADGLWYDGFLAHELQEVHPRAVSGTKDAMMDEEYEITPAVYEDVVTPAVEAVAATYDDEGIELTPAVEATPETTESVLVAEAVMGTRSVPDMQSVDYSKLTPILTAALQEALTKIDALESRLTVLEGA